MEVTPSLRAVVTTAKQYQTKSNSANLTNLIRQLDILISVTGSLNSCDFTPRDFIFIDCISCVCDFLSNPDVNLSLRNKSLQLLNNLSEDDDVCKSLHSVFHLTTRLTSLVITQQPDTVDPVILQCIRILQRITYGQCIGCDEFNVADLCSFLIKQVHHGNCELTVPSLGLLANLTRNNVAVQSCMKQLTAMRPFYKKLVARLSSKSADVVVYAQSVLTNLLLNDSSSDELFTTQNINQTFEYLCNLLIKGQPTTLRNYIVDLLVDMIKNERIQRVIESFTHIEHSVQRVVFLVENVKEKFATKLFELLVEFCTIPSLCAVITRSLCCPIKEKSADANDLLSFVVKWATVTSKSPRSCLPAMTLLQATVKEIASSESDVMTEGHVDLILRCLNTNMGAPVKDSRKFSCSVLSHSLDVLNALNQCNGLHGQLVSSVDTTQLDKILQFQFQCNLLNTWTTDTQLRTDEDDWREEGVAVVMKTLRILELFSDESSQLRDLLLKSLKDGQFVSFLAYSFTSLDSVTVDNALHLMTTAIKALKSPDFSLQLSCAISAANATSKVDTTFVGRRDSLFFSQPVKRRCLIDVTEEKENSLSSTSLQYNVISRNEDDVNLKIDSLISSFKTGIEIKDVKTSELIDVYEHKLSATQSRCDDLQSLLDAKTAALLKSDRLISQHSSQMAKANAEISKVRGLLRNAEKKCETNEEFKSNTSAMINKLQKRLQEEQLKLESSAEDLREVKVSFNEQNEELKSVKQKLSSLSEEHHGLTNIHALLSKHHDALKQQHEVLKQQFSDIEEEKRLLNKQLKDGTHKLQEQLKSMKLLQSEHDEMKSERDEFEEITEVLRSDLAKADSVRKQLDNKVASLELVIEDKEKQNSALQGELSKHSQITALIHNLSSGNVPSNFDVSTMQK